MKKFILFFGLMALMVGGLNAGPVNQQKAQNLGARFLGTTSMGQKNVNIQLNLATAALDPVRGAIDYYVFNVQGGEGFVVVAGDDRVKPILAYSTSGRFNPQDVSEGFAYKLGVFQQEIQYVREHNIVASPDIVDEWKSVLSSGHIQKGRSARSVVGPLCQTIWNQNFPYSSQCPEDEEGSGGHVYAGCVATAMGQVMKFHDWPTQGMGSHTYHPDGYDTQVANFGETEYHFELMPLELDSTSTEEEYFYIAQFLHHCGIAVDMQYSGHGSGAYSSDVPPALRNYFGYSCDNDVMLGYWGWNFYTNEEWAQMLKNGGLDEHLPLYYSGADDGGAGGHAYVCDGYDENDYFHFNWGWSGRDDAWCAIGALNTTKYAFNDQNSFIGHIVPNNNTYYQRADSVADFMVVENAAKGGTLLSWTNPSFTLNGDTLTAIESITLRRNNQVIAVFNEVTVGAAMTYEDDGLEPGLYEYAIYVTNGAGISRNVYRKIMVGEKCEMVFELRDAGGNGWKGAAISVTSESGQRIAVITMEDGAEQTVTVPLLQQNLNLIWNHGWYYSQEGYDTDFECSFTVRDADGNELFTSDELTDGVFMTYNNDCVLGPLSCYPVQNLEGEYIWNNEQEFGARLSWDAPSITANLDHFVIYGDAIEEAVTVPYTGATSYEYLDMSGLSGDYVYNVHSVYQRGEETCESVDVSADVKVTSLDENALNTVVYPNPTKGMVNIECPTSMYITVTNLLGQRLLETEADGNTTIDLSQYGQGLYMLRIETVNGAIVWKVSVK